MKYVFHISTFSGIQDDDKCYMLAVADEVVMVNNKLHNFICLDGSEERLCHMSSLRDMSCLETATCPRIETTCHDHYVNFPVGVLFTTKDNNTHFVDWDQLEYVIVGGKKVENPNLNTHNVTFRYKKITFQEPHAPHFAKIDHLIIKNEELNKRVEKQDGRVKQLELKTDPFKSLFSMGLLTGHLLSWVILIIIIILVCNINCSYRRGQFYQ